MSVFLQPLQTVTVGSGGAVAAIFSNIPQNYTDLYVEYSARTTNTDTGSSIQVVAYQNNVGYPDSTASFTELNGTGTGSASINLTGQYLRVGYCDTANNTSNTFSNGSFYIPNYAGSNYKSVVADAVFEQNGTAAVQSLIAGLWRTTSGINNLNIQTGRTFAQYSTFALYGVLRQGI